MSLVGLRGAGAGCQPGVAIPAQPCQPRRADGGHCRDVYTLPVDEDWYILNDWYTAEAYQDPAVRRNLGVPDPNETAQERMARGWRIHNARVHYLTGEPRQLVECRCRPHFAR